MVCQSCFVLELFKAGVVQRTILNDITYYFYVVLILFLDARIDWQARAIVISPIGVKDYSDASITDFINKSERFFIRCAFIEEKKEHVG